MRSAGFQKGDVAAIFHEKTPSAFAAMIACLKLGVIYTNLDIETPAPRLKRILAQCQPRRILVERPGKLPLDEMEVLVLPKGLGEESAPGEVPKLEVEEDDPAYIMFTSGSTGFPKGAVMSHGNVLRFIHWVAQEYQFATGERCTNLNPMYFDNSVFDFYGGLFNGATLVPFSREYLDHGRGLLKCVNEKKCTIWFSVPSLLVYLLITKAFSGEVLSSLRKIIFGGEPFPIARLRQLRNFINDDVALYNVYGPTECTCICSSHLIRECDLLQEKDCLPLGRLSDLFEGEIFLDGAPADEGELYLRGSNVGLGYYRDPERTQQAFVRNPLFDRPEMIHYKTGDLVSRGDDGELYFKGRVDHQIKHLGYRIELEEIEFHISSLPNVKEVLCLYRKLGDGLGEIVAVIHGDSSLREESIFEQLRCLLPKYMMPKTIHFTSSIPRNANGKRDRLALAEEFG
jgi:D-alanine--poly(phosphoribitol) ligase subunit 1